VKPSTISTQQSLWFAESHYDLLKVIAICWKSLRFAESHQPRSPNSRNLSFGPEILRVFQGDTIYIKTLLTYKKQFPKYEPWISVRNRVTMEKSNRYSIRNIQDVYNSKVTSQRLAGVHFLFDTIPATWRLSTIVLIPTGVIVLELVLAQILYVILQYWGGTVRFDETQVIIVQLYSTLLSISARQKYTLCGINE
jgi:hypothetical protein